MVSSPNQRSGLVAALGVRGAGEGRKGRKEGEMEMGVCVDPEHLSL